MRPDAVSEAIGLVSQETYLFHDTFGATLRFAAPDGYDTVVGVRGYRFSGGDRGAHDELLARGGRYTRLAGELITWPGWVPQPQ